MLLSFWKCYSLGALATLTQAPQKSHVQPCLSDRPWPIGRSCDLQLETLTQAQEAGLRGLGRCRWMGGRWEGRVCQ